MPSDDDLDRQIPGFGGFFFDRDGSPTIYLARGASRGAAEQALGRALSARGLSVASLRVREAQYRWQQLQRWQDAATVGAFDVAGTVFVDNDESSNRIKIGVENTATAGQVRAAVARLGVPDDAVIVQQTQPIVQVATLRDRIRNGTVSGINGIPAGVQINFPGYLCSIGFNVQVGTALGFVTASHCTNTQGGTESTPYWQPLQTTDGTQIATEVDDPSYSKGGLPGCPRQKLCRYSDASRANYTNATGVTGGLGQIARTTGKNNASDLTIVGAWTITADDCIQQNLTGGCVSVGDPINKVGRTTGWSQGTLTNKCVNTGVQGSRIVQLCQNFVSATVGGGDSGSDTFFIPGNNGTNVTLTGVLWGGSQAGDQFVYSPFANVVKELGVNNPLITH
jgi:hypothetical protein